MTENKKIRLKVLRQDGPEKSDSRRWEEFDVDWHPQMNVISALMEIQKNPVTADGSKVANTRRVQAPWWAANCAT